MLGGGREAVLLFYFLSEPLQQGEEMPCRRQGEKCHPNRGGERLGTEVLGMAGCSALKVSLSLVKFSMCSFFVPQFTHLQNEVTVLLPPRHDQ